MRILLIISFVITVLQLKSQFSPLDSLCLGKRKAMLGGKNRQISMFNIGTKQTAYYGIFYKIKPDSVWRRCGLLGEKMPFTTPEQLSDVDFLLYQKNKKQSYVLLGAASITLISWLFYTADGLDRTNSARFYLRPIPLCMLSAYFVFAFSGIHKNHKGDFHLCRAVRKFNATGR